MVAVRRAALVAEAGAEAGARVAAGRAARRGGRGLLLVVVVQPGGPQPRVALPLVGQLVLGPVLLARPVSLQFAGVIVVVAAVGAVVVVHVVR